MIETYAHATKGMPVTERIDLFPEMEIF
jgi:hypothetical protein